MKNIALALILTCIFLPKTVTANDGDNGWVTITDYTLWSNTYEKPIIRVQTSLSRYNPAKCHDPDSYLVAEDLPTDVQQRIYSTLLSALLAKRPIRLYIDSASCQIQRPKILNLTIK